MRKKTRRAIVFVHGISNGRTERELLRDWFVARLQAAGLLPLFQPSDSNPDYFDVHAALWRSLGSWNDDVTDLMRHPQRLQEAVEDVAAQLQKIMRELLIAAQDDDYCPQLLVVGHSMGQVMSVLALDRLARDVMGGPVKPFLPMPVGLITLGGPMGHGTLPARRQLAKLKGMPDVDPIARALGVLERRGELPLSFWMDVWNREDPVCADLIAGYSSPANAVALQVEAPGHPTLDNPLAEHSKYVDIPRVHQLIRDGVRELDLAAENLRRIATQPVHLTKV